MFFKGINKNYIIHYQKGVLKGSLAFMQHFEFVNWRLENSFFDVTNRSQVFVLFLLLHNGAKKIFTLFGICLCRSCLGLETRVIIIHMKISHSFLGSKDRPKLITQNNNTCVNLCTTMYKIIYI